MAPRTFVDTNVFVYAADASDPERQSRAAEVLRETPGIVVSTQVLNEFSVVTTRKFTPPLPESVAEQVVQRMAQYVCVTIDPDLVLQAIRAGRRWQLSHWDALMIEAARRSACEVVLTEDLSDGSNFDGVRIQNPFT
jgi:predicted nucleic acid-binding protein